MNQIVVCHHKHQSVLHLHFHILNTIGLPSLPSDIWQLFAGGKNGYGCFIYGTRTHHAPMRYGPLMEAENDHSWRYLL
uniref:Uncharacterized protein n=1 Tax=Salix viminalis TaxID=40686 RepID=A0A6N2K082_SALVM